MGIDNRVLVNLLLDDGEAYLFSDFFTTQESYIFLAELKEQVSWKEEPIIIFGKKIMQPRLTAWFGDEGKSYSYSGITMHPNAWNDTLLEIKSRVETQAGVAFNSALLNLYRYGQDSNGWHSDNEKTLGYNPVIASVSFGASRIFQFKHRNDKTKKANIALTHGSLLLMQGATQHHWLHCIPKTKKPVDIRINITFRVII